MAPTYSSLFLSYFDSHTEHKENITRFQTNNERAGLGNLFIIFDQKAKEFLICSTGLLALHPKLFYIPTYRQKYMATEKIPEFCMGHILALIDLVVPTELSQLQWVIMLTSGIQHQTELNSSTGSGLCIRRVGSGLKLGSHGAYCS